MKKVAVSVVLLTVVFFLSGCFTPITTATGALIGGGAGGGRGALLGAGIGMAAGAAVDYAVYGPEAFRMPRGGSYVRGGFYGSCEDVSPQHRAACREGAANAEADNFREREQRARQYGYEIHRQRSNGYGYYRY